MFRFDSSDIKFYSDNLLTKLSSAMPSPEWFITFLTDLRESRFLAPSGRSADGPPLYLAKIAKVGNEDRKPSLLGGKKLSFFVRLLACRPGSCNPIEAGGEGIQASWKVSYYLFILASV